MKTKSRSPLEKKNSVKSGEFNNKTASVESFDYKKNYAQKFLSQQKKIKITLFQLANALDCKRVTVIGLQR